VSHAGDADEVLEVLGDELRTVVGDDAWPGVGVGLPSSLQDGLHGGFLPILADFVVDDEAAAAVEDGAEEVKGAGDVEVADSDVPVLVGFEGLDETGALLGGRGSWPGQESGVLANAIDAGRAAGGDIGVEHHEGEPAVAFEGVGPREGADAFFLVGGEPVVAWHPGVVLVDLAEAAAPVVELGGADAEPRKEAASRDVRLAVPSADAIDELVAGVVGDPAPL